MKVHTMGCYSSLVSLRRHTCLLLAITLLVMNTSFSASHMNHQVTVKPRKFYSIFAGRMLFMKINLQYTDILLRHGLVDEVHVWDFCIGSQTNEWWRKHYQENRQFLLDFFNSSSLHEGYRYFQAPESDRIRLGGGNKRGAGYLWESYYNYYSAQNNKYVDSDILIKADDDLVYLDISRFSYFTSIVRTPNVFYFPNILNNDVGLVIQGSRLDQRVPSVDRSSSRHACNSSLLKYYQYYANVEKIDFQKKFSKYILPVSEDVMHLNSTYICPISSRNCNTTWADWDGGLFQRGDIAYDLHNEFLMDEKQFLRNCIYQSSLHSSQLLSQSPEFDGTFDFTSTDYRFISFRRRISVNFFATTMLTARRAFKIFLNEYCCDDEGFLGRWPSMFHSDHIIDTQFAVVHFAFGRQYRTARPKNLRQFIQQYKKLAFAINRTIDSIIN